jgi:hypothetical protein
MPSIGKGEGVYEAGGKNAVINGFFFFFGLLLVIL